MHTQTVALVNGTADTVASLERLFEGGRYDVVFPESDIDAYAEIKRLRPQRVILCTALDDPDLLRLVTMLRLDRATCDIPVLAVTPYGECELGWVDNVPPLSLRPD
jgi:DNA-binding response OmpR family regulator